MYNLLTDELDRRKANGMAGRGPSFEDAASEAKPSPDSDDDVEAEVAHKLARIRAIRDLKELAENKYKMSPKTGRRTATFAASLTKSHTQMQDAQDSTMFSSTSGWLNAHLRDENKSWESDIRKMIRLAEKLGEKEHMLSFTLATKLKVFILWYRVTRMTIQAQAQEPPLPPYTIHPQSVLRISLDLTGLSLIFYDLVIWAQHKKYKYT